MKHPLLVFLLLGLATAAPTIDWDSSTPDDGATINQNWVDLEATITDPSGTVACLDWDDSLVAYWSFDQHNSSGVYDHSSYNHFGTFQGLVGEEDMVPGRFGDGFLPDLDCDSYIEVPHHSSLSINGDLTISFWFRLHGAGGCNAVLGKDYVYSEYYIEIRRTEGTFRALHGNGTQCEGCYEHFVRYQAPTSYPINTWYHAVVTRNATHGSYYENGEHKQTLGYGKIVATSEAPVTIGVKDGGPQHCRPFDGIIDELRIYNRVISEEEILALYDSGLNSLSSSFTDLLEGTYEYTAFAINEDGELVSDTRDFIYAMGQLDTDPPSISWEPPTLPDGAITYNNWVYLNTDITDDSDTSAFFDWNRSLIGYWSFEYYDATNFFDNSTYANHGACNGSACPVVIEGRYGGALEFDGVDDLVLCGSDPSFDTGGGLTLEAWINANPNNQGVIVRKWEWDDWTGYHLDLNNQDLQLILGDGNGTGTEIETPFDGYGEWTHIAATVDQENLKLYINGELRNETSPDYAYNFSNNQNFQIGGGSGWSGEYFSGSIDEVRIHNRALTPEEILASYNSASGPYHNFTSLLETTYEYTAWAIDESGNIQAATRSVTLAAIPGTPVVTLVSPSDEIETEETVIEFEYRLNDGDSETSSCDLYIDDEIADSDSSAVADGTTLNSFTVELSYDEHSWYMSCTDGTNMGISSTWSLIIYNETSDGEDNKTQEEQENQTVISPPPQNETMPTNQTNETQTNATQNISEDLGPICGNGIKEESEECDGEDGVPEGGFWCTEDCVLIFPGEGSTLPYYEQEVDIGFGKISYILLLVGFISLLIFLAILAMFYYKEKLKKRGPKLIVIDTTKKGKKPWVREHGEEEEKLEKPSVPTLDDIEEERLD